MPTAPIKDTTQSSLDIEDITNNIVILKDGGAALVIRVSAVNFNLLSEDEQDAIIYSYAGFLNSLSFPIQILVRSQKKDISTYVKLIKAQEVKQLNPTYKNRLTQYRQFVEKIVKERNVLDKKFYVVIPFFRTELGLAPSTFSSLTPLPTKKSLPFKKSYVIQKALNSLEPKRDHILRQLAHLNLAAKQLTTQELIQLFYTIYNPDAGEGIQTTSSKQYTNPILQSTKEAPAPAPSSPATTIQPNTQPAQAPTIAPTPLPQPEPSSPVINPAPAYPPPPTPSNQIATPPSPQDLTATQSATPPPIPSPQPTTLPLTNTQPPQTQPDIVQNQPD